MADEPHVRTIRVAKPVLQAAFYITGLICFTVLCVYEHWLAATVLLVVFLAADWREKPHAEG